MIMDKLNRLTKNSEWVVGARYRRSKGRTSKLVLSVTRADEVTFLGWHFTGRRTLVGWTDLRRADGSRAVYGPQQWRNRWVLIESAPVSEPTNAPASIQAEELVSAIDFPHLRDGGRWRQNQQHGRPLAFSRACYYAAQLRELGMDDSDIACLVSDLYWDAAEEMRLKEVASSPAAAASDDLPPIEDLAEMLAEPEPKPVVIVSLGSLKRREPSTKVVINSGNNTATLHYAYPYEIDLDPIRTPRDLLAWALHLCQKNWMNTVRLHEVVTAIGRYKKFHLHGLHCSRAD